MSAVALPIGAVMFSFSEKGVLNGPRGQWVNPSALLHTPHAERSTRPVCRVLFVLCPILPRPWAVVYSRDRAYNFSCLACQRCRKTAVSPVFLLWVSLGEEKPFLTSNASF